MKSSKTYALVIGAGAFGTSIASVLSNNFDEVFIKVRSEDVYASLQKGRNEIYLPGHKLSQNVTPVLTWGEFDQLCGSGPHLIINGLPSSAISHFFSNEKERFESYLKQDIPFISLSKGIDPETLELVDDLLFDLFPNHRDSFCFLSGPSFAKEIMQEQITLTTLAGRSRKMINHAIKSFETPYFKCLGSYDVKGVLLGGALKNVIAIAGGIIEGLGFNHNTRAALITRAIAEMLRFGQVFNARPETFYGLSGMGDLILTTTGELSRNKLFGREIASGKKASEIVEGQRTVVEGYKTAKAAYYLAERYEIKARIFNGVYSVLYEDKKPEDVIHYLMKVPSKFEIESIQ